jgi:1,4-dihydroxy-6-naphthoate synthase
MPATPPPNFVSSQVSKESGSAGSLEDFTLRLGHSPDPDDAFMFYGLATGKIDTGRYRFQHVMQDIQTLNQRALAGELEITAISMHAYPFVADKYALTSCGSSMGDKYGPMIVKLLPTPKIGMGGIPGLAGNTIAIPGKLTTAFLAMQLCLADAGLGKAEQGYKTVVIPFDQIPAYVRNGKADAGLLIHEGQLTFANLGLHLVVDLGVWWHEQTDLPLPLGGNCIRRDLGPQVMQEVTDILYQSIAFSLAHRAEAVDYALQFGRDLNRDLADKFVGMYVNDWTLDYGDRGREAIRVLLQRGAEAGLVPPIKDLDFITPGK